MKTTIRTSRLAVGTASLGCGLAMLLAPTGASGQSVVASSHVTITQTPAETQPEDCVLTSTAVANDTVKLVSSLNTDTTFEIVVYSSARLCDPLPVKAVVYKMPGNPNAGPAWPQTLQEVKEFSIQDNGETRITFKKDCDPVQYDLITGVTPETIQSGTDHGPLLFPFDPRAAYQHPGLRTEACVGPSSTSATTTSTSTTSTTVAVKGSTTLAPTTKVLAATTIPSSSNRAGVSDTGLAVTGTTSRPLALIGSGLVLIGVAALLGTRRRIA